ncbi:hypothetical protein [Streptomyces yaizuensis]|uniref:Uncharacterized protein n=1 Tax=Streptomyces yaizuensis TaxID=2989713 RepID=A0ABQ5P6P5_9ACTN|nr:hypothetical protein [Streptomyces sp. YSPA8]GLF98263.1 hypothetical protein SYYSPA8_28220 [Streptomyces sp. YSPA8]
MTATFFDVVRYTADQAGLDDLDRFSDAAQQARARIAQERMDSLTEGQEVRLDRFQDKQLNGLTGTIHSITRTPTLRPDAVVLIDRESLWMLQSHRMYASRVPQGATTYSLTAPLACVFPR